tara:strand:+ start:244 stop:639 length:396 start_codon:yes stop_codon:yes gene_type:complete
MKYCLKQFINFYSKDNFDNLLLLLIIFLNSINLYFFINSKYCVPITIILFYFYYKTSKLKKKKKDQLLLTWLSFSLFSLLGESIIISNNTGISLQYNNSDIYNVSSWLFSAYASMVLSILLMNNYYEEILD